MAIPTVDRPNRGIFNMILREFQIKLPKPRQCISAIKCLICGYKYGYVEQNLDIYFCYLSMATTRMRGSSFFPQGWHLLVGICLFRHL